MIPTPDPENSAGPVVSDEENYGGLDLGQRVRVTVDGVINTLGSVQADPTKAERIGVFVRRAWMGTDIHGWAHGMQLWVTDAEIELLPTEPGTFGVPAREDPS